MPKNLLDTNQSLLEVKIDNRNAGTENKAYNTKYMCIKISSCILIFK